MTAPEQQPAPSSLGQVLAIVQAVVALVPRWLVVAAGLVFVAWLGFELYLKARQEVARTEQIEADTQVKNAQKEVQSRAGVEGDIFAGRQPKIRDEVKP